jgi:hypothetical protein
MSMPIVHSRAFSSCVGGFSACFDWLMTLVAGTPIQTMPLRRAT